ncbi:MAG: hypothetical protein F6K41_32890 [Symploca sp. SIO3E6]|nr:hypothetical protein [Caldora sp. SIO3E6]
MSYVSNIYGREKNTTARRVSEKMVGETKKQTHQTRGRGDAENGNSNQNFVHPR